MLDLFPSRSIALSVGSLDVHWYGILYAVAFIVGITMLPKMLRLRGLSLTKKQIDSLFLWVFLGVVVGGRLGYVLFYGGMRYLENPVEILKVWEGGMSSHGGFVGVLLAVLVFCRKQNIDPLLLADALVIPVAFGLMLGRVGNFINGELFGTITSVPWCMHFPDIEGCRHPTQLYAILKDFFIGVVCFRVLKRRGYDSSSRGRVAATFFILYAVLRFLIEFFRDQPHGFIGLFGFGLSPGQLLTIPLLLIGLLLWWRPRRIPVLRSF